MQNFRRYSAFPQAPSTSSLLSRIFRAALGLVLVFAALFISALLVVAMILRVLFRSGRANSSSASASGSQRPGDGTRPAGQRVWAPPSHRHAEDVVDVEGREVRSADTGFR